MRRARAACGWPRPRRRMPAAPGRAPRNALARERDPQLRQRRRPFVAAVRHGAQVGDGQVALAVGRVGRRGDGRRIGRPHRRSGHGVRGKQPARHSSIVVPSSASQSRFGRGCGTKNALREPEREVGAHLVDALQRRRPRLRDCRRHSASRRGCRGSAPHNCGSGRRSRRN